MKAPRKYSRGATPAGRGSHRFLLTRRTQGMLTVPALAPPVCAGGWGKPVDRLLTVC